MKALALNNQSKILENDIQLRLSIGDQDSLAQIFNPTVAMHNDLDQLGILHEFQILEDTTHSFYLIWNNVVSTTPTEKINGLHEIQFHQNSW